MDAREALVIVAGGRTLTRDEARSAMASVMAGEATPAQLGALLAALHIRGETVDEIAGFASALRDVAVRVTVPADAIDIVGTGGDRSNSFNISTVSAIVTAAAGGHIAKHGNRAASSACGSADVLEALGVKIDLGPDGVSCCVEETRIGFMFAPRYHPAMRHAGPVRREIGIRTVFNVLGPLANPAGVRRILLGVPSPALGEKIARVLAELGTDHALVVHGEDGLDEISPSLPTRTWELRGGSVSEGRIEPEDLGVTPVSRGEITGGDPARNATMARDVIGGAKAGPRAAILMNAGAACYVAGLARDLRDGARLAAEAIDRGNASDVLARFVATSQRIGAAEAATA
ncbi:MAG: anthranilate phosphoribosyltransferase [Chloroflexi bacterium]|nr:MAG: anthranilate phosphoribosyltransferase [Chloroflexota bacterium]